MIRIVEVGEVAWQGKTEPVFCRAEDGTEYIAKGRFAGYRTLIAEWVAGRLGHLLRLPIPEFGQLQIDSELFQYGVQREGLDRLGKGILFGSRRETKLVEIRDMDLQLVDIGLQAKVLAFDWWIANADRVFIDGIGNPNLLWDEANYRLVVIDHNLAFDLSLMDGFWEHHAFRDARRVWTSDFRDAMNQEFCNAIAQMPTIWNEVPEEWTEIDTGISLQSLESLLWRFEREADIFWKGL